MSRTIPLLFALGFLTFTQPSSAQETSSVWQYLGQRATRLTAQLPPLPASAQDWDKQRTELTSRLSTTLGLPNREPMQATVINCKQTGDLAIEEVAFHWAERVYASGTVIRRQQTDGPQPAVVLAPEWLGNYTFRAYRSFAEQLARQGVLVLFLDDPHSGRRHAPYAGLYATAAAAGTQVAGIQVFDALRGFDYLLTRADVDAGKIGIAGLGAGALRSYLAAALEPRFQFVIAVAGTTTYETLVQAAAEGQAPAQPAAFVSGLLEWTDIDRVAACLAPRPVLIAGGAGRWPAAGGEAVLDALRAAYKLYDAQDRIGQVPGEAVDDMTPYAGDVAGWLATSVLPSLKGPAAAPAACTEPAEMDFQMLGYLQRRIESQAASRHGEPLTQAAWQTHRQAIVDGLRTACAAGAQPALDDQVLDTAESGDLVTERLALGVDADFRCPAVLVRPASSTGKCAGVILSHDDRQCYATARITDAARRLAAAGYWVMVPDHASVHAQSLQPLGVADQPSFYGDEAVRLVGPAEAVGRSPLALRVCEDLAAFRYLAGRAEVDAAQIVVAGSGVGGVDACLAALLEDRIAGVAAADVTTMRDWALNVAPHELHFFHLMPYLPSLLAVADWDCVYAALAPRPLVVVRLTDGWPRTGFDQVAARATDVYGLLGSGDALQAFGPRDLTEELEAAAPVGARKQVLAAARTLVPTPPTAGLVGTLEVLKSRATVDSSAGLIWLVAEMSGYEQELAGSGYRLQTWSFFNDNGDGQKGRSLTPLIFRKQGETYELTGIGQARVNAGTGLQTFDLEPVAGTDEVGDGFYFGWYDGDAAGAPNPGVVEFENAPDGRMSILTADGQMQGQRVQVGKSYHVQSEYPRQYSIMAVSKKP
jgi:dienelactone hydrolase